MTSSDRHEAPARTTTHGTAGAAAVRPIDRLVSLYAIAAGAALVFPHRPASWPALALVHLLVVALALGLGPAGSMRAAVHRRIPRASGMLRELYPLLMLPLLYGELAVLNRAVHDGRYFDGLVQGWELALFGGQPSASLAAAFPDPIVSELLHGAYLSYYPLIYGPPLLLLLGGRLAEYRTMVFGLVLTFAVHYLFFIYFPVQGPRYLFPAPTGEIADGALYRLAHVVLEAGSSQGAAFPSSHVAVAVAQSALAARFLPRLFPLVALLTAGLAAGAVYGGFHYATDVVAGFVLGLALVGFAPSVRRRIGLAVAPSRDPSDIGVAADG